jgi:hypothetical protein
MKNDIIIVMYGEGGSCLVYNSGEEKITPEWVEAKRPRKAKGLYRYKFYGKEPSLDDGGMESANFNDLMLYAAGMNALHDLKSLVCFFGDVAHVLRTKTEDPVARKVSDWITERIGKL